MSCDSKDTSEQDTIYALSSGSGKAGVAVIRISGPRAANIMERMAGVLPKPRFAGFRSLRDPDNPSTVMDQALVLWMPEPNSFTGEDVAEFHVHGGRAVIGAMFSVLGRFDHVRMAEAGEFTRRAFENGRIDLVEAEGLADLIDAETEAQRKQAIFAGEGGASLIFDGWRQQLTEILARLEAAIDFSDEDGVEDEALFHVNHQLDALHQVISTHLDDDHRGERLRDGVRVVLAGPVNAGKSTLLNALAQRDVAITSDEAGTTRDVLDVHLDLAGVPVILTDTAGFRSDTSSKIEAEGMKRAEQRIQAADMVLWLSPADHPVMPAAFSDDLKLVKVLTKIDIVGHTALENEYDLSISAKSGDGLGKLLAYLTDSAVKRFGEAAPAVITRARHREALAACAQFLCAARDMDDAPLEVVAENVRMASRELARLVGRIDVEDLLDVIFRQFCIGK